MSEATQPEASSQTSEETLLTERDGGALWIRLNRIDGRNGIDMAMLEKLKTLWRESDADPQVRAIVMAANGKYFCTGADLAPSGGGKASTGAAEDSLLLDYRPDTNIFRDLFRVYWELETPVVSAVNGTVAGAGWMLALLADIVVAAEGARWIHVFAERGMIPHAGDPYFLPRILPFHALNEIALLRDRFTSEDLARWGAVNRLVPSEKVEDGSERAGAEAGYRPYSQSRPSQASLSPLAGQRHGDRFQRRSHDFSPHSPDARPQGGGGLTAGRKTCGV